MWPLGILFSACSHSRAVGEILPFLIIKKKFSEHANLQESVANKEATVSQEKAPTAQGVRPGSCVDPVLCLSPPSAHTACSPWAVCEEGE